MQTAIAQPAALVTYGNYFLRGLGSGEALLKSDVFDFCKSVTFVTLEVRGGVVEEVVVAEDPTIWLSRLRGEGVYGLRLHQTASQSAIDDRLSSAFVGGGRRWYIEVIGPNTRELWANRWVLGDRGDPEQKIWSVTYGRMTPGEAPVQPLKEDPIALRDSLRETLSDISSFAYRVELHNFGRMFANGLEAINSDRPLTDEVFANYAPRDSLPLIGQQLIASAYTSWAFGGMGSWNDLGFRGPDQALYESLSEKLFKQATEAVSVGANTSYTPNRVH